jgi:uncharacterized protein YndB with AHSA1/START domain
MTEHPDERVPPVQKSVVVDVPAAEAFAVFTERPIEWWPETHVLVKAKRERIVIEPAVGGRFYEVAADGTVCDWGRILAWEPPDRVAMTWRVDGRWQMQPDDRHASEIEVSFHPLSAGSTEVVLAHVKLWRHGEDAEAIRAAIDGPSPGETLAKYAKVVAAHAGSRRGQGIPAVTADLYVEIQMFYARQMRLLDNLRLEEYADTYTEDGVVEHVTRGERAEGRAAMLAGMRAGLPRIAGVAVRHWFDKMLVEPLGEDTYAVSYYTLVSRTGADGQISFEPTFTVSDVLVRRDGALLTRSRSIYRDTPAA